MLGRLWYWLRMTVAILYAGVMEQRPFGAPPDPPMAVDPVTGRRIKPVSNLTALGEVGIDEVPEKPMKDPPTVDFPAR